MKKFLSMHTCVLLLFILLTAAVGAYEFTPGSDAVIFVNGTAGNDANSGASPAEAVATLDAAQNRLPQGGTVVVSGATALSAAYNPAAVDGAVLYTSVYGGTDYRAEGAVLTVGDNMAFENDTYFDNIDLSVAKNALVFSARHHNFGFGAGVTCKNGTTAASLKYPLLCGGRNVPETLAEADSDASYTLTVAGGTWNGLTGGNRRTSASHALGTISGDVQVYIEGGTFLCSGDYVSAGGSSYHTGRLYMQITGGDFCGAVYAFRRLYPLPGDKTQDAQAENATQAVLRIDGGKFSDAIATYAANKLPNVPANYGRLTLIVTGGNFTGNVKLYNQGVLGTVLIRCTAEMEAKLRPRIENIHNFLFSNDLSAADGETETAHFSGLLSDTPDPFVFAKDGMYYIAFPDGNGISVAASREIVFSRFDFCLVKVFDNTKTDIANAKHEYWAPEIHYFSADEVGASAAGWYIYVAADNGKDENHRMYVLRATEPENAQSAYEMVGELKTDGDCWAIDGTVMRYGGKLYFVWSGHPKDGSTQQIYIQEMASPTKMKAGARTLLAAPTEGWERRNSPLLEGPQALILDGTAHIVYSANGSWTRRYCLGMLTLVGDDPLDADAWQKSDGPVFEMSETNAMFGTGHASFVQNSLDGTNWIYYHAVPNAAVKDGNDANGTPVFWQARRTFAQQFTTETKTVGGKTLTYPVFGEPLAAKTARDVTIHTPDHCSGAHLYSEGGNICRICRTVPGGENLKYTDINGDGKVGLYDALLLTRMLLNRESDATLADVVRLLLFTAATGKNA